MSEDLGANWGESSGNNDLGASWGSAPLDSTIRQTAPGEYQGEAQITGQAPQMGAPASAFMSPEERARPENSPGGMRYRAEKWSTIGDYLSGAYNAARDAIAAPLSVAEGAVLKAGDLVGSAQRAIYPAANLTGSGIDPWAPTGFSGAVKTAWQGRKEGLRGMGDNPINLAALIPGAAPGRIAAEMGITNPWLRTLATTALGAGEGGILGGAQAAVEGRDILPSAGLGAAIGGGMSLGGRALGQWGANKFPGLAPVYNRNVPPEAKELIRQNVEEILGAGVLPKGRQGFLEHAIGEQQALGKRYAAATESVPAGWRYPVSGVEGDTKAALEKRLSDWGRAGMEFVPGSFDPKLGVVPPTAEIPADALNVLSKKISNIKGTLLKQGQNPEEMTAEQIGKLRTTLTNPESWRDPVGERAMMLKDVGKSYHAAMNDALMGAPNYSSTLGKETPKRYALWSSLEDLIEHPGNLGLAHRLSIPGINPAVDHWLYASALHKAGNAAQKASNFAANILSRSAGKEAEKKK